MSNSSDEEWEPDEAAKPYLEPLIRALEYATGNSEMVSVSSNGLCVTVEWQNGPRVLELHVLVVVELGVYEFEYGGPDVHKAGTLPLNDEQSVDRLVEIAEEIVAMNNALDLRLSDGPDILEALRLAIVEFTDLGPPCPEFHCSVDVDGLDKLCCYVDRVNGGGWEYEVIFFIEDENLVAQHVHHVWDPAAGDWRDELDQWREQLWLFSPTLHQDAIECFSKIWQSMGLLEDQADDLDEAIAAHKHGPVLLTIANALRGFGMGLENATPKGYMPRGFTLGTRRCDNWFTIHADAETDLIEIAVETGWPVPFLEFLEDREGYFKGSKVEDGSGPGRRLVRFWLPLDCPDLISLIDVFIESDMDK